MKLKGKALLSLIMVLAMMVSLFSVSASAAYGESLTVDCGDNPEFSYAVQAGDQISELMNSGLSVTPPEGWYVAKAWIDAGDYNENTALPLVADQNGGTAVSVDANTFVLRYDGGTPVFNDELLSSQGGAYVLHVRFAQIDPNAAVEIRDAWGNVIGNGSVTAPGDPGSDGTSRFVGWRLSYPNGASVLLQPGTTVYPYASATLEAAYAAIVTLHPSDINATAGDSLDNYLYSANVEQQNLPYGVAVADIQVTSNASDPLTEGTYSLYVTGRLVDYNGKDVDPSVAVLVPQDGVLIVAAGAPSYVEPEQTYVEPEQTYVEPAPDYVAPAAQPTAVTVTLYNQSCSVGTSFTFDSSMYSVDPWADIIVAPYAADANGNMIDIASAPAGDYLIDADLYYDTNLYSVTLNKATLTVVGHTHTPGEAVRENNIDPTCTVPGSYDSAVYCSQCGEQISRETVYVDALGHAGGEATQESVVNATCTADGSYQSVVRCTRCGEVLSSETVVIPATGHVAGEPVQENVVNATCEAGGSYDLVRYCTVCNAEVSRETVTTEAIGHNWGDWVVTKPATEAEEGIETRTCLNDSTHIETRPIEKLSHTHTLVKTDEIAATCEKDGTEAYWTCSGCGKLFADEAGAQEIEAPVVIPATGHDWGEWTVTKPATEAEEGVETRVCKNDESHVETRAIPRLDHTHTLTKTDEVAATCEKDGTEAYWTCSGCGKLFADEAGTQEIEKPVVIPATGHDWGEWTVTKPATETEEGVETRVCKNDESHVETRAIPKTGHVHKAVKVARTEPTYTAPGNIEYFACSGCGKFFSDEACTKEITKAETVIPQLAVTEVTVTVADQSWIVGSGATLNPSSYTITGFAPDVSYTVKLTAVGYTGGAGEYGITAEVTGYDTNKYHVTVIPGKLTVTSPIVYPFLDNTRGYQWTQGDSNGLVLKVNADIRKFVCVKVDGAELPENCYIVSSGSTVVTLKPEYLKNLTAANHAITIEFSDGSASTTFTVAVPVSTPQPLTLEFRNVAKAYDGIAYNLASYVPASSGVIAQFHLAQNGQTVAQAVEPGTYDIMLDSVSLATRSASGTAFAIRDSSGHVLSTNYTGGSLRVATLTITGTNISNVTVTVNDQAWTYDGTPHTLNQASYSVTGLQGNDTLTVKLNIVDASGRTLSSVTDAGIYTIKADVTGYNSARYNVTVAKTGTLTVSPYKLTLTAESAVKNYDGSPLRNSNVKATALLSGHKFRASDGVKFSVYDSQGNLIQNGPVAVGTYTKKVTDVHIVDANNIEVTANYAITRVDGTLTINNSDGSPKTGDTNSLTLWIVLLAVSALLILAVATLFLRRGKKKAKAAQNAPKPDTRPAGKH